LVRLGFINFSQPDDPGSLLYDAEHVFVETESSAHAIGMEPHYRLRSAWSNASRPKAGGRED
jgi:hypothetical protein